MMTKTSIPLALAALLFAAAPAEALYGFDESLVLAQSGCASAASQAAAQTGGEVIGVQQSGNVCVVTVLIRDPQGQRPPSRQTVRIPAN